MVWGHVYVRTRVYVVFYGDLIGSNRDIVKREFEGMFYDTCLMSTVINLMRLSVLKNRGNAINS